MRKNLSLQQRKTLLRSTGKSTKPRSIYRSIKSTHGNWSGIPRARLSLKKGRKKKIPLLLINRRAIKKHQLQQLEKTSSSIKIRGEKRSSYRPYRCTLCHDSIQTGIFRTTKQWSLLEIWSSSEHNYLNRARRVLPWLYWVGGKKGR